MSPIVQDHYGEAEDVLRLETIPRPEIADDQVLVRVHAAGVDRGVWHLMAGMPRLIRAGFGLRAPKSRVRGLEFAGVVEAAGPKVTNVAPGDEVYGIGQGTFAEYTVVRSDKIAPKPHNLTFVQAAAAPISALTALQGLRDVARVRVGQRVLVIGASGGVGSFAVQIAKAEVTGVCRTDKVDLVRSLGADHVLDYTHEDLTEGHDVILDTGGHRSLSRLRHALTPAGTLILVGSETGGRWLGGFDRSLRAPVVSMFVHQNLRIFVNSENAADLIALTELIESGKVTPAVDSTYPLSEAATAVQQMVDGKARGKVVITV